MHKTIGTQLYTLRQPWVSVTALSLLETDGLNQSIKCFTVLTLPSYGRLNLNTEHCPVQSLQQTSRKYY